MKLHILFFGMLKVFAGKASDTLDLAEGSRVADVLKHYESRVPRLTDTVPSLAIAVNQQYAGLETILKSGDEVALLPPVSGGTGGPGGSPPDEGVRGSPVRGTAREGCRFSSIVRVSIDVQALVQGLKGGADGAVVVFEGTVRNQTRGRKTLYLNYEAYEEMALTQMDTLAGEALAQFQVRDVRIVHRLGRLEIGETSVLIVVVSAHRAAAFDACRWLIDTLKRSVPIWKKEYFEDGAVWADGEPFPPEIAGGISSGSGSPKAGGASK
jgi:molybdopterin synthase catalytic subunit/molybdopterin converting factor small subunit